MARTAPHILFAGGGTGGHVYPAIAIADAVREIAPDAVIRFAGTKERMEWEAVPKAGYEIAPITISGFHRGQPLRNLTLPYKIVRSLIESRRLVRQFRPDVAVGTGGYVSGPVLLAASLAGVPIVIQEQNAYAGATNRMLGRRAAEIHIAFEEARRFLPADRCVLSGNPTRAELRKADREEARRTFDVPQGAFLLAVFGGSLGSKAINEAVAKHLDGLLADEHLHVLWQTGKQYFDRIEAEVPAHPRVRMMKYVDRMDLAYAAADLALSRSGAITCSELMVTGTPSILVPSPNVAEDHQTHNARSMERAGAAVLLPEAELEARLVGEVITLRGDAERLRSMSAAAVKIARPDAANRIAQAILQVSGFRLQVSGSKPQPSEARSSDP